MFSAFQTFGKLGALASSVARAWSPLALWPDGVNSPGMWISPSTLPASFNDSTGGVPVATPGTVADSANPVGLALDIRSGTPGPELVVNGDFAAGDTGWTLEFGWSVSGGQATMTNSSSIQVIYQSGLTAWKTYLASVTVASVSAGGFNFYCGGNRFTEINLNSAGTYTAILTCGVNGLMGIGANGPGTTGSIDNISFKEIPGNHMLRATAAAQPLESARVNLLVATATLSTQSVTVTAIPHTITFSGGGTVTASGAYVGALTSGQTFTPTAGTLTLTVAGSVTSAMLNRGSTALTYQPVVSASSYSATGITPWQLYDGVDDGMATGNVPAGTFIDGMDCMIAVRRDSGSVSITGLYKSAGDSSKYFGEVWSGLTHACFAGVGTPTVWVDGIQLAGGTSVNVGTLSNALTVGDWHILEFRDLDLSAWTSAAFGGYGGGYSFPGAQGGILLFPSSTPTADRDAARTWLGAKVGLTL